MIANHWALQVLHTVIETGSLQAAANQLHRTSPALSMTLTKLEQDVGVPLLDRTGYRLQLTPHGKLFMRHAREILRQHERLESVVQQLQQGAEPELKIGLDAGISGLMLQEIILELQDTYPATQIRVSSYSQLSSLQHIINGDEDFAITPWLPTFQQMADFESLRVSRFELVAVVAQLLVDKVGMPSDREGLSNLPYIMPQELNMGINPDQIFRMPGRSQIRVNDVRSMVEFVLGGMGWGVLPRQLIAAHLKKGKLVELNVPGFLDHMQAEIHLVKMASRQLGPAGMMLWQHFIAREQVHP
ncbi:MAG: LysR family transcriptional regulator [Idiomarina sp.]|nr:LysR family transcriptional regulator [Idiomarina sp.]